MSSKKLNLLFNRSTPQREAECSSRTLLTFYPITWHLTLEEHILTLTTERTSDLIKPGYCEISSQSYNSALYTCDSLFNKLPKLLH